jgi:hypothetical protein
MVLSSELVSVRKMIGIEGHMDLSLDINRIPFEKSKPPSRIIMLALQAVKKLTGC